MIPISSISMHTDVCMRLSWATHSFMRTQNLPCVYQFPHGESTECDRRWNECMARIARPRFLRRLVYSSSYRRMSSTYVCTHGKQATSQGCMMAKLLRLINIIYSALHPPSACTYMIRNQCLNESFFFSGGARWGLGTRRSGTVGVSNGQQYQQQQQQQ